MKQNKQASNELSRSQQRRREDILQAAIKVFDRDGFEGARMIDIAQEADVAKGTLYLYFETKIALLEGAVEFVILPTIQAIGNVTEAQQGTAEEMLRKQMQLTAQRMASPEMKTLLQLMIGVQHKHQDVSKFYYQNVLTPGVKLFQTTLKYGVERGEFRREVLDMDPVMVVGANVYLAVWNILFADLSTLDTEKLIDSQIDMLLQGVCIR